MTAPLAFACEQTDPNLLPREQRDRIRAAVIDDLARLTAVAAAGIRVHIDSVTTEQEAAQE